jgi:probable rRNA maturation factor
MISIRKEKQWGNNILSKNDIKDIIIAIQKHLNAHKIQKYSFSIYFATDLIIQPYNKTYRNQDKATNTLSFPTSLHTKKNKYIGDIIFALETIENESKMQNKTFTDHLIHLFVHSFLHLLGYDHIEKNERAEMEELEVKILESLNIANPYL